VSRAEHVIGRLQNPTARIGGEERALLTRIANDLIPEGEGMPSAGMVDVAGSQLDLVLRARPDLGPPLARALASDVDAPTLDWLRRLAQEDPEAHAALTLAVVGAYYLHPRVKELLGYEGQTGEEVTPDEYLRYVNEGLLDPVLERGRIFRDPGDDSAA
jgi:hypothetical protein